MALPRRRAHRRRPLTGEITGNAPRSGTSASTAPISRRHAGHAQRDITTANPTRCAYLRDELQARGLDDPANAGAPMMNSPRRMRRQARRIRRGGMQPMMVITGDDQLPETAVVILLRYAWRYRSELAPLYVALAAGCAAGGCTPPTRTGGRWYSPRPR